MNKPLTLVLFAFCILILQPAAHPSGSSTYFYPALFPPGTNHVPIIDISGELHTPAYHLDSLGLDLEVRRSTGRLGQSSSLVHYFSAIGRTYSLFSVRDWYKVYLEEFSRQGYPPGPRSTMTVNEVVDLANLTTAQVTTLVSASGMKAWDDYKAVISDPELAILIHDAHGETGMVTLVSFRLPSNAVTSTGLNFAHPVVVAAYNAINACISAAPKHTTAGGFSVDILSLTWHSATSWVPFVPPINTINLAVNNNALLMYPQEGAVYYALACNSADPWTDPVLSNNNSFAGTAATTWLTGVGLHGSPTVADSNKMAKTHITRWLGIRDATYGVTEARYRNPLTPRSLHYASLLAAPPGGGPVSLEIFGEQHVSVAPCFWDITGDLQALRQYDEVTIHLDTECYVAIDPVVEVWGTALCGTLTAFPLACDYWWHDANTIKLRVTNPTVPHPCEQTDYAGVAEYIIRVKGVVSRHGLRPALGNSCPFLPAVAWNDWDRFGTGMSDKWFVYDQVNVYFGPNNAPVNREPDCDK